MEIWRDIPKYEGLYQVSNYGRVKSLNYKRTHKEKIINPAIHPSGHLHVLLYKDGSSKTFQIHRLVAEAFIPNPNKSKIVHHIDHNPQNNRIENLEWLNRASHQALHNVESRSKIVYQYTLEGELVKIWESASEASRQTNISFGNICNCCRGGFYYKGKWIDKRQSNGYKWSYVPL